MAQFGADAITSFKGRYSFLSNYYKKAPFVLDGVRYIAAEHSFQAQKSTDPLERARIASAYSPTKAKALGRAAMNGAHGTKGWFGDARDVAMRDVLAAKFAPNSELATKLLATGQRQLVEGNTWGDTYWGYCTDGSGGENKLGQLLMQRRDELRALAAAAGAAPPKPAAAAGAAAALPPTSAAAEPAGGADGDTKLGKRGHDDDEDEGAMKPSKHAKPEDAADAGAEAHDVTVIE